MSGEPDEIDVTETVRDPKAGPAKTRARARGFHTTGRAPGRGHPGSGHRWDIRVTAI